jgi:hypothetical protein
LLKTFVDSYSQFTLKRHSLGSRHKHHVSSKLRYHLNEILLTSVKNRAFTHVLPLNEQEYGDVVKILKTYVSDMENIYVDAGYTTENMPNVQIGGDQLTRERFSCAKSLRLGTKTPSERFDKLFPVSCEFFHMAMKCLTVCFKNLWSEAAVNKVTLYAQKVRLQRNQVKYAVKDSYNECKDFFVLYIDALIVECILAHFDIDMTSSTEAVQMPVEDSLKQQWIVNVFSDMIRANVGTFTFKCRDERADNSTAQTTATRKFTYTSLPYVRSITCSFVFCATLLTCNFVQ